MILKIESLRSTKSIHFLLECSFLFAFFPFIFLENQTECDPFIFLEINQNTNISSLKYLYRFFQKKNIYIKLVRYVLYSKK